MASAQQQDELPVAMIVKRFKEYLLAKERDQLLEVLTHTDTTKHFGIYISIQDLISEDVELGNIVLNQSMKATALMDISIREAENELLEFFKSDPDGIIVSFKELCHCRFYDLPPVPEFHKPSVGMIRSDDLGRLVQFSGTVIRTGVIKMLESEKEYECQNQRCRCHFKVKADIEQGGIMEVPTKCPANSTSTKCKSTIFKPVEGSVVCCDYEEILVQERIQMLDVGTMPRSIPVILLNDLVDSCKAGDDIVITGIVRQRWKPLARDLQCEVRMIVVGLSIRLVSDKDNDRFLTEELIKQYTQYWNYYYRMAKPFLARNLIVESVCPDLYGLYLVKLSLLLILIGGVSSTSDEKNPVRGQSHLLIVGDSSTGKSELLLFASKVAIRSVMTTGLGTTSAGLTCSAVKDSGEWMLEGGALVLGDKGVCCIDEFNSIREHDRATIHEAMEQQRLSVAKAGIVTTLNTRTVVIATCNPRGKYDVSQDISVNTSIASPLLSRFDLILLLLDQAKPNWDKHAVNHILESYKQEMQYSKHYKLMLWSTEFLKGFILYIQRTYQPRLSVEAQKILSCYYRHVRTHNCSGTQATVRLLESLIRLAQAHARLMMRHVVLTMDAIQVVMLMECSVFKTGLINTEDLLYISFPRADCHETEYLSIEASILFSLHLEDEIPPTRFEDFIQMDVTASQDGMQSEQESGPSVESSVQCTTPNKQPMQSHTGSPSMLFSNQSPLQTSAVSLITPSKHTQTSFMVSELQSPPFVQPAQPSQSTQPAQSQLVQPSQPPRPQQSHQISPSRPVQSQVVLPLQPPRSQLQSQRIPPSQPVQSQLVLPSQPQQPQQITPSQPVQSQRILPSQLPPQQSQQSRPQAVQPSQLKQPPAVAQQIPAPTSEEELFDEEALFQLLDLEEDSLPPPSQPLSPISKTQKGEIEAIFNTVDASQNGMITIQSQKEIESSLRVQPGLPARIDESVLLQSSQLQHSVLNSVLQTTPIGQVGGNEELTLDDMEDLIADDIKGIL